MLKSCGNVGTHTHKSQVRPQAADTVLQQKWLTVQRANQQIFKHWEIQQSPKYWVKFPDDNRNWQQKSQLVIKSQEGTRKHTATKDNLAAFV